MNFDIETFDVPKFDAILQRGLSKGIGDRDGSMCIEAAICTVLDLPHGDDPGCVANSVRAFKIALNDSNWSSAVARSNGLRDLGLAQLGSLGVIDDHEFTVRLAEKTIRVLIPKILREVFPNNQACLGASQRCESEGTREAALAAARAGQAAVEAALAAARAGEAAVEAAWAAGWAARAAARAAADTYLMLSARLALEVLIELESPGCALLKKAA